MAMNRVLVVRGYHPVDGSVMIHLMQTSDDPDDREKHLEEIAKYRGQATEYQLLDGVIGDEWLMTAEPPARGWAPEGYVWVDDGGEMKLLPIEHL